MRAKFILCSKRIFVFIFLIIISTFLLPSSEVFAQDSTGNTSDTSINGFQIPNIPGVDTADSPKEVGTSISLILILTVLSLAPSIIILFTSFIRIAIVFSFARTALATQQVPPNQVLYGLALILTFFIMASTFNQIYEEAYVPYQNGELSLEEFGENAILPIREFMIRQMNNDSAKRSLNFFIKLGNVPRPKTPEDIPLHVLIPAFVLNELTIGFKMGVSIFIPFIVIDLIVSSVLLSVGIIFLPPVIVSLPIKIMLFVLVDGWNLLVENLVKTFL